jgi:hypothetical protein
MGATTNTTQLSIRYFLYVSYVFGGDKLDFQTPLSISSYLSFQRSRMAFGWSNNRKGRKFLRRIGFIESERAISTQCVKNLLYSFGKIVKSYYDF